MGKYSWPWCVEQSIAARQEGVKAALTRELMIRHNFKRSITPSARTCIERAFNLTRQDDAITAGTPKDKARLLSTIRRQIIARKSPFDGNAFSSDRRIPLANTFRAQDESFCTASWNFQTRWVELEIKLNALWRKRITTDSSSSFALWEKRSSFKKNWNSSRWRLISRDNSKSGWKFSDDSVVNNLRENVPLSRPLSKKLKSFSLTSYLADNSK